MVDFVFVLKGEPAQKMQKITKLKIKRYFIELEINSVPAATISILLFVTTLVLETCKYGTITDIYFPIMLSLLLLITVTASIETEYRHMASLSNKFRHSKVEKLTELINYEDIVKQHQKEVETRIETVKNSIKEKGVL